jgi:arsenate reductase-like glutaredoxin family protein
MSAAELQALIGDAEITAYLNTRSASYRAHGFKGKPPTKTEAIKLMVQDPNLIKRPITVKGSTTVFGFDEAKLRQLLGTQG